MKKEQLYVPPEKYPHAKSLAKEFNELNSRKRFRIDKELPHGVLISYRIITIFLFVISILFAAFRSPLAYERLLDSLGDLYSSLIYYSLMFFEDVSFEVTVNNIPDISFDAILPIDLATFKHLISVFFEYFFKKEIIILFLIEVADRAPMFTMLIMVIVLSLIVLKITMDLFVSKANGRWFEKTKLYKFYEKIYVKVYYPSKIYVSLFFRYQKGHCFFTILKLLWFFNLNLAVVLIECVAYYFFFCRAFDLSTLYVQFYKLALDVGIFLYISPLFLLLGIAFKLFLYFQKRIGMKILALQNASNFALLDKLSMSSLITAAMGGGKTSMAVVLALLQSIKYRNDALGIMYKYYQYFYRFPWSKFRKKLDYYIKQHYIYNLASIEDFFADLRRDFEARPCAEKIFGYDIDHYDVVYNNGIIDVYIWEALEIYAEAYFVYVMQTSLIAANFPIREDYLIINAGNMIYYDNNLYSHPVTKESSHFSHILDWDTLRMGKTLVVDSEYRNSFEFGIIVATEEGKERPNGLETMTVKPTAAECNQKNDMLPHRIKMSRHAGTIDNINFFCKIGDEQRAVDVSAEMRQVSNEIAIEESSKQKVTLPLFVFYDMIRDLFFGIFKNLNDEYDKCHGENGLFMQLVRDIFFAIIRPIDRLREFYSYKVVTVSIGKCSDDKTGYSTHNFYLHYAVAYKRRYSTDTHRSHFRKFAERSPGGLNDAPVFTSLRPSNDQLMASNSLWLKKMIDLAEEQLSDDSF